MTLTFLALLIYAGNESLYSILGQVRHKVAFIEEHVPADCELTLVGHSVGCFVILQLLKHFDSDPARGVNRDGDGALIFS